MIILICSYAVHRADDYCRNIKIKFLEFQKKTVVINMPFRIEYLCIIFVILTTLNETVHWHSLTYSYVTNEITFEITFFKFISTSFKN